MYRKIFLNETEWSAKVSDRQFKTGKKMRKRLEHETGRGQNEPLHSICANQCQVPNLIWPIHFREGS